LNPGISKFFFKLSQDGKALYPVEAYNFVYDTILHVSRYESFAKKDSPRGHHLSPKKICSILNTRMKTEFGSYVTLVLKTWNVSSSGDIGKIVLALSDYNCLKLSGSESQKDFDEASLGDFL